MQINSFSPIVAGTQHPVIALLGWAVIGLEVPDMSALEEPNPQATSSWSPSCQRLMGPQARGTWPIQGCRYLYSPTEFV